MPKRYSFDIASCNQLSNKNSNMHIKVIGAGVGRTGTASLKLALHILGFKSYHMNEVIEQHPSHINLWLKKAQGTDL